MLAGRCTRWIENVRMPGSTVATNLSYGIGNFLVSSNKSVFAYSVRKTRRLRRKYFLGNVAKVVVGGSKKIL